jgi:hypothetical protein
MLLLDAYRVWQQGQKGVAYDLGRIERIMSETYMLIKQVGEGRDSPVCAQTPYSPRSSFLDVQIASGMGFRYYAHPIPTAYMGFFVLIGGGV